MAERELSILSRYFVARLEGVADRRFAVDEERHEAVQWRIDISMHDAALHQTRI